MQPPTSVSKLHIYLPIRWLKLQIHRLSCICHMKFTARWFLFFILPQLFQDYLFRVWAIVKIILYVDDNNLDTLERKIRLATFAAKSQFRVSAFWPAGALLAATGLSGGDRWVRPC
jgi:hypothetical protein